MAKLSILIILCLVPYLVATDPYPCFSKIDLPPGVVAPQSVSFDPKGEGPYIAVNDGRILKYQGPSVGFVDFAYTSPKRTKKFCDGVKDLSLAEICGRPLRLSFDNNKKLLYIADAFKGVFVGLNGGLATHLFNVAEGVPLNYPNGIATDPITGEVYVTDGSLTYNLRNISDNFVGDNTGRLIKYNPKTKEVKVLLKGLPVPVGPIVSLDGTFLLFSERKTKRVMKYWLVGHKANTAAEVLLDVPGNPIEIRRASAFGEFWVPVNVFNQQCHFITPYGFRFNSAGMILQLKVFQEQYNNSTRLSGIQEYNKRLYISSLEVAFLGVYSPNY